MENNKREKQKDQERNKEMCCNVAEGRKYGANERWEMASETKREIANIFISSPSL